MEVVALTTASATSCRNCFSRILLEVRYGAKPKHDASPIMEQESRIPLTGRRDAYVIGDLAIRARSASSVYPHRRLTTLACVAIN